MYFMYEGITTLEYLKDQDAGFPALPPKGWRQAVLNGDCYDCGVPLDLIEVEDAREVWFCTICQGDIGKAGLEFHSCERCDNVNVCPLCYKAAQLEAPIVTYCVASLRRRVEAQAHTVNGVCERAMSHASHSRLSSFSSQREPRGSPRTITAVVANVEGHTGDTKLGAAARSCCAGRE